MKCSPVSTLSLHDLYLLSWHHPPHIIASNIATARGLHLDLVWCATYYLLLHHCDPHLLSRLSPSFHRWQTLSCIFIQVVVSPSCPAYRSGIRAISVEVVVALVWPSVSNVCGLAKCIPKHIPEKELCSASNGRGIEAQITPKHFVRV